MKFIAAEQGPANGGEYLVTLGGVPFVAYYNKHREQWADEMADRIKPIGYLPLPANVSEEDLISEAEYVLEQGVRLQIADTLKWACEREKSTRRCDGLPCSLCPIPAALRAAGVEVEP